MYQGWLKRKQLNEEKRTEEGRVMLQPDGRGQFQLFESAKESRPPPTHRLPRGISGRMLGPADDLVCLVYLDKAKSAGAHPVFQRCQKKKKHKSRFARKKKKKKGGGKLGVCPMYNKVAKVSMR